MIIESKVHDKIVVLYPKGRLDFTLSMSFEKALGQIVNNHPDKHILLDLNDLEYLNSSSLRVVTVLAQSLRGKNLKLFACQMKGIVKRVMEITNIIELIEIVESEEQAMKSL